MDRQFSSSLQTVDTTGYSMHLHVVESEQDTSWGSLKVFSPGELRIDPRPAYSLGQYYVCNPCEEVASSYNQIDNRLHTCPENQASNAPRCYYQHFLAQSQSLKATGLQFDIHACSSSEVSRRNSHACFWRARLVQGKGIGVKVPRPQERVRVLCH